MKIYTKAGDKGETSLFGGTRVSKDVLRIEAYGTVDEINSVIGICRSMNTTQELDRILDEIQHDLFRLGADLATPRSEEKRTVIRMREREVIRLESHIDRIDTTLEPLRNFILPGGNRSAAMLHFTRTVCRRAERLVVRLAHDEDIGEMPVKYLNRLSDLLFVLARWVNAVSNTPETKWNPDQ
ncbi:MAG: cob(I)yrinic acid a,c-diamide adenosyltransferase [Ignavibacteriae bacterium]|nr:cob(I)yrinic acid a,c-diamide adenosyltransferase [Ignavibacteria bacterium]MBI3363955.1 cob(I)yrinic acid a,c-diamide adenosyltransferase [Ignavibacteriota bacterium]